MNELYDDPLANLETLLLDWDTSFRESHQRLHDRLQKAKDRLEHAWRSVDEVPGTGTPSETDSPPDLASDETQTIQLQEVKAELLEALEGRARLEQSLQRAYEKIRLFEQERTALLLQIENLEQDKTAATALREELRLLKGECAGLRANAEHSGAEEGAHDRPPQVVSLEQALRETRHELELERGRRREQLLDTRETSDKSSVSLTERLREALRDRDEAHQEIVRLRSETESLRRHAAAPTPAPESIELRPYEAPENNTLRLRLGQLLEQARVVSHRQLEEALEIKKHAPERPLGAILVTMGATDEDTIAKVIATQLNLPYMDLESRPVDPAAAALISGELARHHGCIPLALERGLLMVAMANPLDLIALEDLELATRRRVDPVIATPSAIAAAIERHYLAVG